MSEYTNDQYIDGIRRKDRVVMKAIYRAFFPAVARHIRNNSGTQNDAEDVFQNALMAMYVKVRDERLELTAAFGTYLFQVCKNQWLNRLRGKKRQSDVTVDDPAVLRLVEDILPEVERAERLQLLREKFDQLRDDCRRLLDLAWHSDKNMQEIAEVMGMSYAFARKRKHECQERLKGLVKADRRYRELSA